MDSVMRLVASSSIDTNAERIVQEENHRLTSEEKKRRLLSFGPGPSQPISVVPGAGSLSSAAGTNPASAKSDDPDNFTSGSTFESSSSAAVVANGNFACLETTSNLFLRHAGQDFVQKFFDLANKYEILNSDGNTILYAGETMERFGVGHKGRRSTQFDVTILLPDGTPILNVVSRRGVATISDFQKVVGTCIDTSSCLAPNQFYSIRDWNMCEIFELKKSTNGPQGEFDILSKDSGKVGQFTNNWNASLPNYIPMDKLYGISFPLDMCTDEKAILAGALFMLYFQHLHEGAPNDKQRKFWIFCLCICFGIVLVITVFTLILWGILKDD